MDNTLAFGHAFKVMGATQQLMVRSLVNLIEMISTSSHRYAQGNSTFTSEALSIMQKASATKDPESLRALQKEWADTCMKFSQSQTRMTMGFVEQFGQQVLGTMATSPFKPSDAPEAPVEAAAPEPAPKPAPAPAKPKAEKKPSSPVKVATPKAPKAVSAITKAKVAKAPEPKVPAVAKTTSKAVKKPAARKNSTLAEKS